MLAINPPTKFSDTLKLSILIEVGAWLGISSSSLGVFKTSINWIYSISSSVIKGLE